MTTILRLRERAKESFRTAMEDSFRTGKWDPILRDAYENAEADLAWEEAQMALDALTEAEAREAWGK